MTGPNFSPRTRATIEALADTFLPGVDGPDRGWTASGRDLLVPDRFPDLFARLPHDSVRRDLAVFLRLLGSRSGGLMLYRKRRRFADLAAAERAEAINSMAASPLVSVRMGAKFLKVLLAMLWVTTDEDRPTPPVWQAMRYPGPDGAPPEVPKAISLTPVTDDQTWTADVVVVGSGAGGGVAAGVLAQAGLEVVVLEKGGYRNEADFNHLEEAAYRDMYLQGLLSTTTDGGLSLVAGATLGGGTVINWTTSFPTPARLRDEWDRVAGFSNVFSGPEYEAASQAVSERLNLTTEFSSPSRRDALMEEGLRSLGWHVGIQSRNVNGCSSDACGYCFMGCRIGAKRSTLVTYLQDAYESGARIVVDADVRRVLVKNGQATGVEAAVNGAGLTVRARSVVLAAGALNTPAILLRSGIGGRSAGRHLHLHPVTGPWGRFEENVEPWTGMMQARYTAEFSDLDGDGYGFILETGPIHPVLPAAYIGWENGEQFKRDVIGLRFMAPLGVLLRDHSQGRVTTRRDGSPRWEYRMGGRDLDHMRLGVRRAAEVLAAAGAVEVISSTVRPVRWRPGRNSTVDTFMADVDSVGYGPNQTSYATLHQMGGARMGSDPSASVVGPYNEVHDTRGLYVMDSSCFPTASGVNPMISVSTIAHRAATALAFELT
ncbi:MAG: GMC family oxidoreductase N-terminal domain-containing protein [Acidimicrobiia bacterium]